MAQFQDQQLADQLWQAAGLQQLCAGLGDEEGCPVRLNPNIRIYRYRPGQKFGKHIDESNELGCGQYTQYTLLIYLSTCGGGETIFYGESGPAAAHALLCACRSGSHPVCSLQRALPAMIAWP